MNHQSSLLVDGKSAEFIWPSTQDQAIPTPTLLSLPGRESRSYVPQTLWLPQTVPDRRQYVELAELQLPIFFESFNGRLGYSLDDAACGRFGDLRNGQNFAPLRRRHTFTSDTESSYARLPTSPHHPQYPQWHIGPGFIDRNSIIIIGAVHVSAGSWMPIIQLNRYIL
ncbi:hypothetical protein BGW80DRAFT_1280473, partial [Lactifluus volemus]